MCFFPMAKEEQRLNVKIKRLLNRSVQEKEAGLDKDFGDTSLSNPTQNDY